MKYNKGESNYLFELITSGKVESTISPGNIRHIVENFTNKDSCAKIKSTCAPHNYSKRIGHVEQIVARDLLKYYHKYNKSKGLEAGYVYLISNPAWNSLKIGSTIDVGDRLASYQTYSPNRDYVLEFYFFSFDRKRDESVLIKQFCDSNEWTSSPRELIVKAMKALTVYR